MIPKILNSKIIKGLLIVLLFLIALEILLQVASLIQNYKLNKLILSKGVVDNDNNIILCVGDSFTQGMGALSPGDSYPAQLQLWLNKNSTIKSVVYNCGVASTNSSELVHFLPKLLEFYSPRYLLVLIGCNDYWNYQLVSEKSIIPSSISSKENKNFIPWRLRFRTFRLIKMILKYFSDRDNFLKNSYLLTGENFAYAQGYPRAEEDIQSLFNHGIHLYYNKEYVKASQVFQKIISLSPEYLEAHIQLSHSLVAQKKTQEALEKALFVRKRIMNETSTLHKDLAMVFHSLGYHTYARDEISQYKKYYPEDLGIYELLGFIFLDEYNHDKAEEYLKKVIEIDSTRPNAYRGLARIYISRDKNLKKAIEMVVKAYLLDKNINLAEMHFSTIRGDQNFSIELFREMLERMKETFDLDAVSYKELMNAGKSVCRTIDVSAILKNNLSQIAYLCSRHNTTPIFMTYPPRNEANKVIREFCHSENELMFDSEIIFNNLLKNDELKEYFVPDYHLNSNGYRILAQEIGKFLIEQVFPGKYK